MMIWLLAGAMLLVATGCICYLLLVPANRNNLSAGQSAERMNTTLYREYVSELERQYPAENEADRRQLLVEAQRQLLMDEQQGGARQVLEKQGSTLLIFVSAVLMVLAVVLYAHLGAMADVQIRDLLEDQTPGADAVLRSALLQRLEQKEDSYYYWLLLARLELNNDHPEQAVTAYRKAHKLSPQDAGTTAELAQALFVQAGHQLTREVERLVAEALKLDLNNTMALELAGIAASSRGDYQSAITFWQRAVELETTGSPNALVLKAGIARLQALLNNGTQGVDNGVENKEAGENIESNEKVLLALRIELAEQVRDSLIDKPDSTLFVYVREWQGPPVPLVAQRFTVADLPVEVSFTDAMSLSAGRKLSTVNQLEVIARISDSGNIVATTGDIEGRLGPLSLVDKTSYSLIIDQRLP
ncbi:MAG: c-type cytochrome biogenesis protein CcmI [Gammaproteobacteria bacterium]|nr:MAG: c-type cytochrome biogenesis protein CcmI [Gammaproteobacteria bacterium]